MSKHPQHPLNLVLQKSFLFETFDEQGNAESIALLKKLADGDSSYSIWYCWGKSSAGKTHLAQAVCEQARLNNINSFYLDLNSKTLDKNALDGLEAFDLVCIDGLDAVVASPQWQEAIFHLINRLMSHKKILMITANKNIKDHQLTLPDLASRLAWGINLNIKEIANKNKPELLTLKAEQSGFKLPTKVAIYLINQFSSDMKKLVKLLEVLNKQALSEKKLEITIPFVKKVLT